jgi:hypothetical protein
MPPSIDDTTPVNADSVEFSIEDALLNAWVDDTSDYLRLDTDESAEPPLET